MAQRFVISVASIAVLGVALGCGCGDREAEKLRHVKDAVCECKDVKCAEAALRQLPSGDEVKRSHRSQVQAREMLDCMAKLYEAERPSTDPDAATSPGTPGSASAGTR
jgi:hypothetical protein